MESREHTVDSVIDTESGMTSSGVTCLALGDFLSNIEMEGMCNLRRSFSATTTTIFPKNRLLYLTSYEYEMYYTDGSVNE